jgi:site-specific recombinase XerD
MKPPPVKPCHAAARGGRKYLTPSEVERVAKAAGATGRHRHRDRQIILCMYRHGLRISELVALRRDALDLGAGDVHIRRAKGGKSGTHPLVGDEIRAYRKLLRDWPQSPYLFVSERGAPLTPRAVHEIIARAGRVAGIGFPVNPHSLRHACGYKLANEGRDTRSIQDYLGHASITNTVVYTQLSSTRFKDFWDE